MGSISHVITNPTLPHPTCTRSYGLRLSHPNSLLLPLKPTRVANKLRVSAVVSNQTSTSSSTSIDFSDPDWKTKFQEDFEARFRLPHITDIFPDATPIRSTFCLKMRTPIDGDIPGHYSSDEEWHGYINNNDRVLLKTIYYSSPTSAGAECFDPKCTWVEQWVHRAGPREKIYFQPEEVKAAIVTCGGLCPGLNDVIRQIVITLEIYGVKKIVGIPFGYRGFSDKELTEVPLSRKVVQNIHLSGGSLLGVSRGGPGVSDIVDSLEERGINMLFVLGGNGTHAGANAIHNECCKRRLKVSIIGVPKTIDNDILLMDKTFGFDTAVEEAQRAINSAYIEAHSAYHGIGVVKLMGRSSGFIAMQSSLSSGQVDICLIPEVPFNLHGPHGVLNHLKYLLETKGSAVLCVAEGAGQNLLQKTNAKDASGNIVFGDIGVYIQQETKKYFKEIGVHADVKYIDPTYMIRAIRANASDGILCTVLGQNAVHGAFAGYSGITVGLCNTHSSSVGFWGNMAQLMESILLPISVESYHWAYAISALMKIYAFEVAAGRKVDMLPECQSLIEELLASHCTDLQQRTYELLALVGLDTQAVETIMPRDASCENIEVGKDLSFESKVAPFSFESSTDVVPVPEALYSGETHHVSSVGSASEAGLSELKLRLDGVQKKWGRPTYSSTTSSTSYSTSQKPVNGATQADGATAVNAKVRDSYDSRKTQVEISPEKQKLAASLFGVSTKPEERSSTSHKVSKASASAAEGSQGSKAAGIPTEVAVDKKIHRPPPVLVDLGEPTVITGLPSVDPFKQLEGFLDPSISSTTNHNAGAATNAPDIMALYAGTNASEQSGSGGYSIPVNGDNVNLLSELSNVAVRVTSAETTVTPLSQSVKGPNCKDSL